VTDGPHETGDPPRQSPRTSPPTLPSTSTRSVRTVRIGLTGPIGCGKSTVAAWLGELGAVVIDADRVARQVAAPGGPVLPQIAATFGEDLIDEDGSLDRAALGRIVFADPAALAALEAIVHPAVRPVILEEMAAAEHTGAAAVVVEAIKLVEGGLASLCDEVWLVACSPDVQLARAVARAVARGADPSEAEARIAAQSDLVARLAPAATRILDTSGDLDATRALVADAFRAALAHSARRRSP
jgi:dephospho-CoA kinase